MARRSFPEYYQDSGPNKEPLFWILVVPLWRGPSMFLKLERGAPLGQQVYQGFRRAILAGEMAPATRLPSTRTLALELGVSRNVVLLAYEQLLAEGYAEGRGGSGTYVASALPE